MAILLAVLVALGVLIRSLLRDLRRVRRRANPQYDLNDLYYVAISTGCWMAVLVLLLVLPVAPGAAGLAALPFVAGFAAAASIRFVPRTHPAWLRVARHLQRRAEPPDGPAH